MRRLVITAVVALAFLFIVFTTRTSISTASAQKQRRRPAQSTRRAPAVDYSRFSHATPKHQGACNTCHKLPTDNWKQVRDFPDVADFPDHDACVSCHRPQFFRGARPPICSVCHTKVSPRDEARFAFRNPASLHQFLTEFPHDKHQDVIATSFRWPAIQTVSLRAYAHSRGQSQTDNLRNKRYNNCEICHLAQTVEPTKPVAGWVDSFVPDAATFKTVPDGHNACFNCHWKSQQPTSENCAGCHKLAAKPFSPVNLAVRLSMKFRHAREQHVAECTTCHINITKSASLRGLTPDVPITSCTECHNKDGLRQDVSKELEALDKNREFACSYCHTSDVGRRDAPSSHYLIAGRPTVLRTDIK